MGNGCSIRLPTKTTRRHNNTQTRHSCNDMRQNNGSLRKLGTVLIPRLKETAARLTTNGDSTPNAGFPEYTLNHN
jgi:hypothetical protein